MGNVGRAGVGRYSLVGGGAARWGRWGGSGAGNQKKSEEAILYRQHVATRLSGAFLYNSIRYFLIYIFLILYKFKRTLQKNNIPRIASAHPSKAFFSVDISVVVL